MFSKELERGVKGVNLKENIIIKVGLSRVHDSVENYAEKMGSLM